MSNHHHPGAYDSVSQARYPFGLPPGSVRGMISLIICMFFWIVILWPQEGIVNPLLGHFFLLALVLLAFASSPTASVDGERATFLPWLMRFLFVGGSVAVVAYALIKDPAQLQARLTPNPQTLHDWWLVFLATTAAGFCTGLLLRFLMGRRNYIFQTLRAWLSVVGMVMLGIEIGLFIMYAGSQNRDEEFLNVWAAVELYVVAAYFGTRA